IASSVSVTLISGPAASAGVARSESRTAARVRMRHLRFGRRMRTRLAAGAGMTTVLSGSAWSYGASKQPPREPGPGQNPLTRRPGAEIRGPDQEQTMSPSEPETIPNDGMAPVSADDLPEAAPRARMAPAEALERLRRGQVVENVRIDRLYFKGDFPRP